MYRHFKSLLNVNRVTWAAFWLLVSMAPLCSQVIKIEAGTSQILPSHGGSVNIQSENYESYVGAGSINGTFQFGANLKTSFDGYKFILGDQNAAIGLPTDVFGSQQYFLARGAAVSGQLDGVRVFLFGGATALGVGSRFFQAAQAQIPMGMLFLDIPLSDKLEFFSRNLGSERQTSIHGFNWRPRAWLKTAVSAGIGGNQPYFASAAHVERDWIDVKVGYIEAGNSFRRITTPSIFAAEPDRENILVTMKPISSFVLTGGHQNLLLAPGDLNAPFLRASVNQLQATYTLEKFRLGAGIFQSHSQNFRNASDDFSISRPITRNLEAGVNYFHTLSGTNPKSSNLSGTIRERISPKLSLLQVINRSPGNTSVLFGGNYATNRFALGVDYQTLYLPFMANPFSQGLTVSLRIRLFGSLQILGETFRSADGRLRYNAGADTLLVHNSQRADGGVTFRFPKYVVRGHVRDESGAPIEGAALRIGDQVVHTNVMGEFLFRTNDSGVLQLTVDLPEFLNPIAFTVVSAPVTVAPATEDVAPNTVIILRPVLRGK